MTLWLPGGDLTDDIIDFGALAAAAGPDSLLFFDLRLKTDPTAAPPDRLHLRDLVVRPA